MLPAAIYALHLFSSDTIVQTPSPAARVPPPRKNGKRPSEASAPVSPTFLGSWFMEVFLRCEVAVLDRPRKRGGVRGL
jgi:hypothetical protein